MIQGRAGRLDGGAGDRRRNREIHDERVQRADLLVVEVTGSSRPGSRARDPGERRKQRVERGLQRLRATEDDLDEGDASRRADEPVSRTPSGSDVPPETRGFDGRTSPRTGSETTHAVRGDQQGGSTVDRNTDSGFCSNQPTISFRRAGRIRSCMDTRGAMATVVLRHRSHIKRCQPRGRDADRSFRTFPHRLRTLSCTDTREDSRDRSGSPG